MANYSPISIARFWSKVDVKDDPDACWEWQAYIHPEGYGRFSVNGGPVSAHRFALEVTTGEPLGGKFALHSCDNRRCCNPNHLSVGNHAENARHAVERNRTRRGERAPNVPLNAPDVVEIRRLIAAGETNVAIAEKFGVSNQAVSAIRTGKTWAWLDGTEHDQNKKL